MTILKKALHMTAVELVELFKNRPTFGVALIVADRPECGVEAVEAAKDLIALMVARAAAVADGDHERAYTMGEEVRHLQNVIRFALED